MVQISICGVKDDPPPKPKIGNGSKIKVTIAGPVRSGKSTLLEAFEQAVPSNLDAEVIFEEVATVKGPASG